MWRLILAMIAFAVPTQSGAAEILLKCESTASALERDLQDWFVRINGTSVGDAILVTHVYPQGQRELRYEVIATGDQIGAVELSQETGSPKPGSMLTLDRISGRATMSHLIKQADTATLWNEQKQQLGGFEGDTWLGSHLDCVPTQRVF